MKILPVLLLLCMVASCGQRHMKSRNAINEKSEDCSKIVECQDSTSLEELFKTPPLNAIRFKDWTSKEWLDNDYIRALRKFFDDYCNGKFMPDDFEEQEDILAPYTGLLKGEFMVYSIEMTIKGGVLLSVLFKDAPETMFSSWIYSDVDEEKMVVTDYKVKYVIVEEENTTYTTEDLIEINKNNPQLKFW